MKFNRNRIIIFLILCISIVVIANLQKVEAQEDYATNLTIATEVIRANNTGYNGYGITIAILDWGINGTKFFKDPAVGNYLNNKVIARYSALTGSNKQYADLHHGTIVASTIVLNVISDNTLFIGSAPRANIASVEIFAAISNFKLDETILSRAINWILYNKDEYNIRVAVCSWGWRYDSDGLIMVKDNSTKRDWMSYQLMRLVRENIIVTVGMSESKNSSTSPRIGVPESATGVIAVGALQAIVTDQDAMRDRDNYKVADWSGHGPTVSFIIAERLKPDVVAPGVIRYPYFRYTENDDEWVDVTRGTSLSNPLVAGGIAQVLQAKPDLTPAQVLAILRATAYRDNSNVNPNSDPNEYGGWGIPDIYAAIQAAKNGQIDRRLMIDNMYYNGYLYPYWRVNTYSVTAEGPNYWNGNAIYISYVFDVTNSKTFRYIRYYNGESWSTIIYSINVPYAERNNGYRIWYPSALTNNLVYAIAYAQSNTTYVFKVKFTTSEFDIIFSIILENDEIQISVSSHPGSLYYIVIDADYKGGSYDYVVEGGETIYTEKRIIRCRWYSPDINAQIRDKYYTGYIGLTSNSANMYYDMCTALWILKYEWNIPETTDPDTYLNGENVFGTDIVLVLSPASSTDPARGTATWINIDLSKI